MHARTVCTSLLAAALAGALAFSARAQSDERAAKEKELDAAREQLEDAARRVARLSRELGEPGGVYVFDRRALQRPVLGVVLEADATRGVRISGVTPDSGAAAAGLRAGDRIVAVDGNAVTGNDGTTRLASLRRALAGLKAGKAVTLGIERDGRASTVQVTPGDGPPVTFFDDEGGESRAFGDVRFVGGPGEPALEAERFVYRPAPGKPVVIVRRDAKGKVIERRVMPAPPGTAPQAHHGLHGMPSDDACRDHRGCRHLALAEALRWNGLNLAAVDASLGRYFGTTSGVLVVSAGPELAGLQSGDVIRSVDGRVVRGPREVMDVLRTKPEGSSVRVDYLRDRTPGTTQLKVPKAMRFPLPAPPPPPPAPPAAGRPSAAPVPPADAPPPPPAPPTPPAGIGFVDPGTPPVPALASVRID